MPASALSADTMDFLPAASMSSTTMQCWDYLHSWTANRHCHGAATVSGLGTDGMLFRPSSVVRASKVWCALHPCRQCTLQLSFDLCPSEKNCLLHAALQCIDVIWLSIEMLVMKPVLTLHTVLTLCAPSLCAMAQRWTTEEVVKWDHWVKWRDHSLLSLWKDDWNVNIEYCICCGAWAPIGSTHIWTIVDHAGVEHFIGCQKHLQRVCPQAGPCWQNSPYSKRFKRSIMTLEKIESDDGFDKLDKLVDVNIVGVEIRKQFDFAVEECRWENVEILSRNDGWHGRQHGGARSAKGWHCNKGQAGRGGKGGDGGGDCNKGQAGRGGKGGGDGSKGQGGHGGGRPRGGKGGTVVGSWTSSNHQHLASDGGIAVAENHERWRNSSRGGTGGTVAGSWNSSNHQHLASDGGIAVVLGKGGTVVGSWNSSNSESPHAWMIPQFPSTTPADAVAAEPGCNHDTCNHDLHAEPLQRREWLQTHEVWSNSSPIKITCVSKDPHGKNGAPLQWNCQVTANGVPVKPFAPGDNGMLPQATPLSPLPQVDLHLEPKEPVENQQVPSPFPEGNTEAPPPQVDFHPEPQEPVENRQVPAGQGNGVAATETPAMDLPEVAKRVKTLEQDVLFLKREMKKVIVLHLESEVSCGSNTGDADDVPEDSSWTEGQEVVERVGDPPLVQAPSQEAL